LISFGAKEIRRTERGYFFTINTSTLLNRFGFGRSIVAVSYLKDGYFNIKSYFHTRQKIFAYFQIIIISIIVLSYMFGKAIDVIDFVTVPIFIICLGHLDCWGVYVKTAKRVKEFFFSLPPEELDE